MLPTPQGNADGGTRRGGMEGGTMQESVEGGATQGSEPGGARPKSGSKLKYSRHRPTSDDHGTSQSKLGKSHPKSGSKVKDSQHHQHEAAGPGNMEKSSSKGRPKSGSKVRDDERHDGVVEYGSRTPHNNSGRGRPKSGSNFRNDKGQQNRRPVNPEQMPQVQQLTPEEISRGLQTGHLIQGQLRINPKDFNSAYVPHPDGRSDVLIDGIPLRKPALSGDIVAVQLFDRTLWQVNSNKLEELEENLSRLTCDDNSISSTKTNSSDSHVQDKAVPESIRPGTSDHTTDEPDVIIESDKTIILQTQDTKSCDSPVKDTLSKNISTSVTPQKKKQTVIGDVLQHGSPAAKKLFTTEDNVNAAEKCIVRTGKVVAILEKKHSRMCAGHIVKSLKKQKTTVALFRPTDSRVPRIMVPLSDCPKDFLERPEDHQKTLYVSQIIDWKMDSLYADGVLVRRLGEVGEIEPMTEGILVENDVDSSEFSPEVLESLPIQTLPWTIPAPELVERRDFRHECVFTIDPATARDLDDALSVNKLEDGTFDVGVHIADVGYFLKENTNLDLVAGKRATSVYLVQKVIPMLPRILCEQLCSLNPDEDRLTFSVVWNMSEEGEVYDEWFGRSVIRSCCKLSYDHAQGFIETPTKVWTPDELPPISAKFSVQQIQERVLNLNKIAVNMRKRRMESGALTLNQVKMTFTLDADTGMPNGFKLYEQRDSNRLVEEFMLLANMAVAHKINGSFSDRALLRRHPHPQTRMADALTDLCNSLGVPLDVSSAGALQKSLKSYWGEDDFSMARQQVLTSLCSKPMQLAQYFCNGCIADEEEYRHYALNVPLYTHFTSPIRRYADVLVHRALAGALGNTDYQMDQAGIQRQANQCNDKKKAAKIVQELSSELYFAAFIKEAGPLEEVAMVMGVLDKAFDIFVLKFGVTKRVHLNKLDLKDFSYIKEQKKPILNLVWKANEDGTGEVTQKLSIFSMVTCRLAVGDLPLTWMATIKKPITAEGDAE